MSISLFPMNQSDQDEFQLSIKRRKLLGHVSEKESSLSSISASITDIDCVEDIFLHIMTYFVGNDGIDVSTIENAQYVCQRWKRHLCLPSFWNHVEATTEYSNETLKSRLVGFINLGSIPSECTTGTTVDIVKQRSTGTIYKLKIFHSISCHPRWSLREIAARKQVERRNGCVQHLSLLHNWCRCGSDLLHWYEHSSYSLLSYLETQTDYNMLFRNLLFQCLLALKELHGCGIQNVNLSMKSILLFPRDSKTPLVKLCDFEDSIIASTILMADCCEKSIEGDMEVFYPKVMYGNDCFRLSQLFGKLLKYVIHFRHIVHLTNNVHLVRSRGVSYCVLNRTNE